MPWFKRESIARQSADPSCQATRRILQTFGLDFAYVKRSIQLAQSSPAGFPASEWDNIIRGVAVNIDNVYSSLHHVAPVKENVGRVGSTEISLGYTEPSRRIRTNGDWISAYNEIVKATFATMENTSIVSSHRKWIRPTKGLSSMMPPSGMKLGEDNKCFSLTGTNSPLSTLPLSCPMELNPIQENEKLSPLPNPNLIFADDSILRMDAQTAPIVATNTFVETVNDLATTKSIATAKAERIRGLQPKYLRYNLWSPDLLKTRSTASWTESAQPLPSIPLRELQNRIVAQTISENPSSFKIVTPINVNQFEFLLQSHPNKLFVQSVCKGLREGFWPWADTLKPEYPTTHDASVPMPDKESDTAFLRSQKDIEVEKQRFSPPFGTELLPGMYSMPIHAVPKPRSTDLRMVTDQSAGQYSLNFMIPHAGIAGYPLDNMKRLGEILLDIRKHEGNVALTLFKSDVAEAYRLMPVHPFWQIKQINTVDGLRFVDRNNAFGGRASGSIWIAFSGLVAWIAKNVKGIPYLSVYSDDFYAPEREANVAWCDKFQKFIPSAQKQLLDLWTELGIPFKERKQVSGPILTIIGIEVNVNDMTLTLPGEARMALISEIEAFIGYSTHTTHSPRNLRHALRRWQRLAGWINWGFNVFPLLRPCLNTFYPKIKGKEAPNQPIWLNNAVKADLLWALSHIRNSSGVHLLTATDWTVNTSDLTIYCDACLDGMAYWYPDHGVGYYCEIEQRLPDQFIFYWEALCILSALSHAASTSEIPMKILIFTDNANTVDIFHSLRCLPEYNAILKHSVDICLATNHQLRVLHVPGEQNIVADALSRKDFTRAIATAPGLKLRFFEPPRLPLGASKK